MKNWPKWESKDGVFSTKLEEWDVFHSVVANFLDLPHYVFRGQRMATWQLEPSLARILGTEQVEIKMANHLEAFKLASRGRRGANPPQLKCDNDWWALGQHHGLATPLLDWTTSPYVGLFFALADPPTQDQTRDCVVYALNRNRINDKNIDAKADERLEFFQPLSDENSRLVAQAGMFSRCPMAMNVEAWVAKHFPGEKDKAALIRIFIPYSVRSECLKALSIMNINHTSLFPDLYGAGKHCTELLRRTAAKGLENAGA